MNGRGPWRSKICGTKNDWNEGKDPGKETEEPLWAGGSDPLAAFCLVRPATFRGSGRRGVEEVGCEDMYVCVEDGSEWGWEVRRWGLMGGAERMGVSVCPGVNSAVSLFFFRYTWGALFDHPPLPRPVFFLPPSSTHPTPTCTLPHRPCSLFGGTPFRMGGGGDGPRAV